MFRFVLALSLLWAGSCGTVFADKTVGHPSKKSAQWPPEFKKPYHTYTDLIKQGKAREAVPYAKQALDIALKSKAFDDEARGRLAFNLGYVNFRDNRLSDAVAAFTQAIKLLQKTGSNSTLIAQALVYRGICYSDLFKYGAARPDLERALKLLKGKNPAVQLVRADALESLAWVEIDAHSRFAALQPAQQAHQIYARLLGNGDLRTLRSLLAISAGKYVIGSEAEAKEVLAEAVDLAQRAGLPEGGPGAKAIAGQFTFWQLYRFHREVAALYRLMKREADARYHDKIASELIKGWTPPSLRVKPTKRTPPYYPQRALRRGIFGWVLMEYTVLKDGSTADIKVIDSGPKGYFEDAAVWAIKRWTFEPLVEDGKPVDVKGVRTMIRFAIRR